MKFTREQKKVRDDLAISISKLCLERTSTNVDRPAVVGISAIIVTLKVALVSAILNDAVTKEGVKEIIFHFLNDVITSAEERKKN